MQPIQKKLLYVADSSAQRPVLRLAFFTLMRCEYGGQLLLAASKVADGVENSPKHELCPSVPSSIQGTQLVPGHIKSDL